MKKKSIYTIIVFLLVFACTKDNENDILDEASMVIEPILPKKMLQIDDELDFTTEINFKYSNTKIDSITSNEFLYKFEYQGDLINKIESFTIDTNAVKTKDSELVLEYLNNKLIAATQTHPSSLYTIKTTYEHLNDNEIHYKTSYLNQTSNENPLNEEGELIYENGLLIKETFKFPNNETDEKIDIWTYKYDFKTSPFKNILGINALLNNLYYITLDITDGLSNITSMRLEIKNSDGSNYIEKTSIINSYNRMGYPIRKYYFLGEISKKRGEFIFEY